MNQPPNTLLDPVEVKSGTEPAVPESQPVPPAPNAQGHDTALDSKKNDPEQNIASSEVNAKTVDEMGAKEIEPHKEEPKSLTETLKAEFREFLQGKQQPMERIDSSKRMGKTKSGYDPGAIQDAYAQAEIAIDECLGLVQSALSDCLKSGTTQDASGIYQALSLLKQAKRAL
jgi:hypothetical protein